jgi:Outer membrane lipoprotein-sorting protein
MPYDGGSVMKHLTAASGFVLVTLLGVTRPPVAAAIDVTQVLRHVQDAVFAGKDVRAHVDFEIVNAKGESVHWSGEYYRRSIPDRRVRIVFDSPIDLRGTEVSVGGGTDGETHMRVYLPGLRRVRDITADMRGESFFGTDFNYEDLGLQSLDFRQQSLEEGKDPEGRDCYRLESVPQSGWWYGRIVYCVDRKTFLPLRTDYYDRAGVLWKVRTFQGVQTIKSHPTATQITMQTLPTKTLTRITLSEIAYDTGLADVLFEGP